MTLGGLRAAASARDRMESGGDRLDEARLALDLMARDLRGAFLSPQAGSPTRPRIRFIGGSTGAGSSVVFHTTAVDPDAPTDLAQVGWLLEEPSEGPAGGASPATARGLVRWSDPIPGGAPFSGGIREESVPGATGLRLRYFDGNRWLGSWGIDPLTGQPYAETSNLPQAVEISLTLPDSVVTRTVWVPGARRHE